MQRGAQAFFESGVIKRHSQQIVNCEVPAYRQGQQLGKMFGCGGCHLGAKQAAILARA